MNDFLQNPAMQVLIAVVMVSFVAMEARGWVRAFRRVREKRVTGAALPELPLARPFSFLLNCAGYADAALVTLIAMDMLAGSPYAENTLLLALPLTVSYLAYLISGPIRMKVVERLRLRGGLVVGAAGTLVCFAFVAASVVVGNFWAYVVAIFVKCCFFYLLVSCVRFMPTIAESEHERIEINTETDNADVSAAALIGLVTGFAAQCIGNVYAYLIAMVPCAVLVCMILRLIPRDMAESGLSKACPGGKESPLAEGREINGRMKNAEGTVVEGSLGGFGNVATGGQPQGENRDRRSISESSTRRALGTRVDFDRVRSFLAQPSMMALFFFALITLGFSGCYRSYLFPIFANDGGLNKAAISTITVFCSAFVFYVAPPLTRLAHRVGPRRLLSIALVVCACVFLGFLVTGSMAWAIVALFLVLLIKKVGEPCARTLWPRAADAEGLSRAEGQAAYEVIDGIVCFAKMPVTGALLSLGQIVACAIFGIYSLISAVCFWASTRRGPFQDKGNE